MLDGTVKVIEGRGYEPDGTTSFNALGILSYDVATKTYRMRSHAMGMTGDFVVQRTADGFAWEIPAGPTTIRYNAIVKDGIWIETGDRVAPGRDPVRFFEMRLERIGDSEWPPPARSRRSNVRPRRRPSRRSIIAGLSLRGAAAGVDAHGRSGMFPCPPWSPVSSPCSSASRARR